MHSVIFEHTIPSLPSGRELTTNFGTLVASQAAITAWKETARSIWVSSKRRSYRAAIKEFCACYKPSSYFVKIPADSGGHDDSFEIFYTV